MGIGKNYSLYVFDFDGTLVDTRTDIARTFQVFFEELGYPVPTLDEVRTAIGGGAKKAIQRLSDMSEEMIDANIHRFHSLYAELCADNTIAYPGAQALLARLKAQGALLAVVTMKARIPTHNIIAHLGLSMLDDVVSIDDVEKPKPDPQSMFALFEKHGLQPAEVLMIGDTTTDQKYAQAAGTDFAAVTFGYGDPAVLLTENPTYVINDFNNF